MAWLDELSAGDIAAGVAAGDFSAVEVTQASLSAIDARDGEIAALIESCPELALDYARRIDERKAQGQELGCLAGVPVSFKDNMQLIGTHTTCASRMLEGYESVYTATCVQRMLDAGAIPVAKANMDEFAFGSSTETSAFHPTRNPWDTERVPGGSSGGSAVSVAAGEVTLSLGSDTGGSIRQPASFCGVVGLKPSYGAVSRYGVVAFGSSLDQVGPLGRSVSDVVLAMQALTQAGRDRLDSTSQDCQSDFCGTLNQGVAGGRVGVMRELIEAEGLSDEVRDGLKRSIATFESAGAEIVDVELEHLTSAIAAYYVIGPAEAFSNLARFDGVRYGYQEPDCETLAEQTAKSRAHGFGIEAKRRQMLGAYLLASGVYDKYYYPAQKLRTLITDDYNKAYERCDVILLPVAPTCAWKLGEITNARQMYLSDMFTISNNIAGNCGISVPVGLGSASGMPLAAQLQGPAFGDATLLRYAHALESEVGALGVAPAFFGKGGEL
ncbi:MAG: Asp-tRNA(Asn)/Glu-tRNA(Gln) amidotransferase subunit GatA [Atopobiaceae bacterium]|nr:Asp-tRNA(Asn)/Glu-tRNA(Gln) amidotransferase subunit GatA [Atopobiaceae bacterium]